MMSEKALVKRYLNNVKFQKALGKHGAVHQTYPGIIKADKLISNEWIQQAKN